MEDTFVWTDEIVEEFEIFYNKIDFAITGVSPIQKGIQMFKKSKQPKLDYEIMSFKHNTNVFFNLTKDGLFHSDDFQNEDFVLSDFVNNKNGKIYEIHSVKRFKDNEIFSVGEIVNYGTIEKMIISWVGLEVQFTNGNGATLASIEKIKKQLLFTTEDNVKIYEGDEFVSVQKRSFDILTDCIHPLTNPDLWFTFSTEEAAKEYVLMNKPCLSLNDILNIGKLTDYRIEIVRKEMTELAKQKINSMKKVLVILIMSTSFLSCKKDNTIPQNNLFSVSQAVVPQVAITMLDAHIKTSIIKGDTTINTFDNSNVIGYVIADKTDLTKVTLIYVGKIKKLTLYGKKTVMGGNVFYRISEKSGKEIYSFTTDIQQTHAWNFHVSELPMGI